jgi:uncharacterized protein (DUF1330 family)
MTKGYVVSEVFITDPVAYRQSGYLAMAEAAIAAYGGRFLVRGGDGELLEGSPPPNRIVVVEFPTVEAARRFRESPEYAPALRLRQRLCETRALLVKGV